MTFQPLEASLARLAINESAHHGERSAAAGKFFLFLKERGVTAEEFLSGGVSSMAPRNKESDSDQLLEGYRRANLDLANRICHLEAKVRKLQK